MHFRGDGETLLLGESLNLSAGGMLVATPVPLDPGLAVQMRFPLPFCPEPHQVRGRVVYVATVPRREPRRYSIGISFADIDADQERTIDDVCRRVLSRMEDRPDRRLAEGELALPLPGEVRGREGTGEPPADPSDKRRWPRVPSVLEVRFESEEAFLAEYTTNISSHGLFVQTEQRLAPLSSVDLALEVRGHGAPIRLRAVVVYRLPGNAERFEPPGLGLHLDGSDAAELARLHELADELLQAWGRYP